MNISFVEVFIFLSSAQTKIMTDFTGKEDELIEYKLFHIIIVAGITFFANYPETGYH